MEADLRRFYDVDLVDLWRGRLSIRQLWVYVKNLPRESGLAIAENGGMMPLSESDVLALDTWREIAKWRRGRKFKDHKLVEEQKKRRLARRGSSKAAAIERAKARDEARRRKLAGRN